MKKLLFIALLTIISTFYINLYAQQTKIGLYSELKNKLSNKPDWNVYIREPNIVCIRHRVLIQKNDPKIEKNDNEITEYVITIELNPAESPTNLTNANENRTLTQNENSSPPKVIVINAEQAKQLKKLKEQYRINELEDPTAGVKRYVALDQDAKDRLANYLIKKERIEQTAQTYYEPTSIQNTPYGNFDNNTDGFIFDNADKKKGYLVNIKNNNYFNYKSPTNLKQEIDEVNNLIKNLINK